MPDDIEGITETREYMAGLPQKIDAMSDRITKNDTYFKLLDEAKWKIPGDQMDLHWDVFRWPSRMHNEMKTVVSRQPLQVQPWRRILASAAPAACARV